MAESIGKVDMTTDGTEEKKDAIAQDGKNPLMLKGKRAIARWLDIGIGELEGLLARGILPHVIQGGAYRAHKDHLNDFQRFISRSGGGKKDENAE